MVINFLKLTNINKNTIYFIIPVIYYRRLTNKETVALRNCVGPHAHTILLSVAPC